MLEVNLNQANCVFFIKSIQLCLICNKGYKILDRACIHLNPNCDLYSPDGECKKCVSGYTLNKTICIEIIPALYIDVNCKNNHKSKCIECKDGYLLTK